MPVSTRLLWPVGCGLLLLGSQPAAGQTGQTGQTPVDPGAPASPGATAPAPRPVANKEPLPYLPTDSIPTITLDFACRCFGKPALTTLNRLRHGQLYRLRILHINPLLYKITLGVRDTTTLAALPFPTFASVGLSDLAGLAAGLTATAKSLPTGGAEAFYGDDAQKKLSKKTAAERLLATRSQTLKQQTYSLANLTQRLDTTLLHYGNQVALAHLDFTARYTPTLPTPAHITQALRTLSYLRQYLGALRQQAETANAEYLDDVAPLRATINANAGFKQTNALLDTTYQTFSATLAKVVASTSDTTVQQLVKALTAATNNSALQYVSLPQQFTKDRSRLRIDIVPRSGDYAVPEFHTQLVYPLTSKQFWGVSTGFFVSQLASEAYSARAQAAAAGAAPTYRLVAEDPGKLEFGLSAMVRCGTFLGPKPSAVGVQFGFGPALAVGTKVRPRLLVGGGLAMGREHKLLLDGGLALGYTDRLSRVYDLTTDYATAPDNPVVSTLKTSFYAGLHYLFTR